MGRPTLCTMAFRSIRDHSHMRFADSFTQDMDFWRQRVGKEGTRLQTPSSFAGDTLADLPRNPFKDSAGMLLGAGVSPRMMETPLGALSPNLASFRAATETRTVQPNTWHLPGATPYHLPVSGQFTPEMRAMKGALRLLPPPPPTAPAYQPSKMYEKHLIIEAPDQRICASLRRGMPRARLDARMYAASPD